MYVMPSDCREVQGKTLSKTWSSCSEATSSECPLHRAGGDSICDIPCSLTNVTSDDIIMPSTQHFLSSDVVIYAVIVVVVVVILVAVMYAVYYADLDLHVSRIYFNPCLS